jgi:GntR family carbon starvation induced transcriptional regulator
MVNTSMRLFDHAERYRHLSPHAVVIPREHEHKELVDALLLRSEADAIALISDHFRLTAKIVIDFGNDD